MRRAFMGWEIWKSINNLPKVEDTYRKEWLRSGAESETQAVWHQRTVLLATAL